MADVPTAVRAHLDESFLEVRWPEAGYQFPFKFLRGQCPCAECVDENTGQRILDVQSISEQIRPMHLAFSGNYALKVHWNDGHQTGLYTWDHLERLAEESAVTKCAAEDP